MFCTKCGNLLHDGDRFCAHCGAKVREEVRRDIRQTPKYEEVVFNPPFREEAEKRTRRIAEESPYSKEPKREAVHFDWNLDGFPGRDEKKEDDFELNWDEVIERRRDSRPIKVEKIIPEEMDKKADMSAPTKFGEVKAPSEFTEPTYDSEIEPKEEILSIAALERELFGADAMDEPKKDDKGATIQYSRSSFPKDEQFYTYNAKRDAFQELLDKEKQRIEEMEIRRKSEWDEIAPKTAPLGEVKKTPKFEEVFVEPELPLVPPVKEVAVVIPPLTATVMAYDEADDKVVLENSEADENGTLAEDEKTRLSSETAETVALAAAAAGMAEAVSAVSNEEDLAQENTKTEQDDTEANAETSEEKEESVPPFQEEKTKLRYSDIFPADAFDDSGSDGDNDVADAKKKIIPLIDDEDDEEEYKGNKVVKTLIIILAIIVAVELVIIGFKTFAPDSGFSKGVDGLMKKVTSIFDKDDNGSKAEPEKESSDAYMYQYVNELKGNGANIGNISYNSDLYYDLKKSYAFEQIGQTGDFKNGTVEESEDGEEETCGRSIVEAVIGYYNGWQERNDDPELVGINSLEIGEIRSGNDEYFVLNKVTYAKADGNTAVAYQTVRLVNSADGIIVDEMKEESV